MKASNLVATITIQQIQFFIRLLVVSDSSVDSSAAIVIVLGGGPFVERLELFSLVGKENTN